MKKLRVGILFGGKSGEHEVSIVSATYVSKALDKTKYDITIIGIDKDGRWLMPEQTLLLTNAQNPRLVKLNKEQNEVSPIPYESKKALVAVSSGAPSTDRFDVVIPILHGTNGEDGTMQGLLELANVAYVGSGVLGSAVGMDKDVAKRLLAGAGISVVPGRTVKRSEFKKNEQGVVDEVIKAYGLPFFVKPANQGSSVGVHKVKTAGEAIAKIRDSLRYDVKVLIEKGIEARELECAVLGNDEPKASIVGEIIPHHEFYSYEAKYMDENGAGLDIPAKNCDAKTMKEIQDTAIKAFKALELRGLARVDFFMDKKSGQLYLNEVNTMPGFTQISMYPKLWIASGMTYEGLLDELIRLALERHAEKNSIKTTFDPSEG